LTSEDGMTGRGGGVSIRRILEIRPCDPRDRVYAVGTILGVAGVAIVLFLYHPSTLCPVSLCPVKAILNLECPGCGSGRALHHLLNLRFIEAWRLNPGMIVLGLPLLLLWLMDLGSTLLYRRRVTFAPGKPFGLGLVAVLGAYMLARNLA
jgi:hypothetical protein